MEVPCLRLSYMWACDLGAERKAAVIGSLRINTLAIVSSAVV